MNIIQNNTDDTITLEPGEQIGIIYKMESEKVMVGFRKIITINETA